MIIRNKDIMQCLPLLASVLGDKYGVKIEIGGNSAYTDGKTIHIPKLPIDSDPETMILVRGYTDHESAHVRHTDFEALSNAGMDAITKNLFNSIEDWRVENKLGDIFPGCRSNFRKLIIRLFANAGAGDENPALLIPNYVLMRVRSWDAPELDSDCRRLSARLEANYPGLVQELDQILNRVSSFCPDTAQAIEYAFELAFCIRDWQNNKSQNEEENQNGQSGNENSENWNEDVPEEDATADPASNDEISGTENMEKDEDNNSISKYEPQTSGEELYEDLLSSDLPQNLGEMLSEGLEQLIPGDEDKGIVVAEKDDPWKLPLSDQDKIMAVRSCNALRHRLGALLQAKTMKQVSVGRHGRLSTKSLYRLEVGNPKMFVREDTSRGINTAIQILLDRSYSMEGLRMEMANQACYALSRALCNIKGINLSVTAFPGSNDGKVVPILDYGQRIGDNFALLPRGSTPLDNAMWWGIQNLCRQKEERKIILILTDGAPNDEETAQKAISQAEYLGIEVYGIGIQSHCIENIMQKHCKVIMSLDELAPAMFSMLQNALLREVP